MHFYSIRFCLFRSSHLTWDNLVDYLVLCKKSREPFLSCYFVLWEFIWDIISLCRGIDYILDIFPCLAVTKVSKLDNLTSWFTFLSYPRNAFTCFLALVGSLHSLNLFWRRVRGTLKCVAAAFRSIELGTTERTSCDNCGFVRPPFLLLPSMFSDL